MTRKPKAPTLLDYIAPDLRPLAVPVESLNVDPQNARKHDEKSITAITASLRAYGQRKPLVVNRNGNQVEAGHGTLEAATRLGWSHLAVVWVQDDRESARGFSLADNRSAELSTWGTVELELLLSELRGDPNQAELYAALDLAELEREILSGAISNPDRDEDDDTNGAGLGTAVLSYNLVFDDDSQQQAWFRLIRKMKDRYPDLETHGARLAQFIEDIESKDDGSI